ncbi:MAG: hypothetical protein OEN00_17595, partial [Gemmatimonadota bacterium]|nr:hypothetical protein [Gemmatimonadota bacterium]
PISDEVPAGRLETAYRQYRSTPVAEWTTIRLTDDDIIALVNVRFISQSLKLPAERVLANTVGMVSFVELHARLRR